MIRWLHAQWQRIQTARWFLRWPVKTALFLVVLVVVLFPNPFVLSEHINHLRRVDSLPDPDHPEISVLSAKLDRTLREQQIADDQAMLQTLERLVCREVHYAWDWDLWGAADYWPTTAEVFAQGREDCDGRAVVAAALLRHRGIDARIVGDPRHIWVDTPLGPTMNPLGDPIFHYNPDGTTDIAWSRLFDPGPIGFGISVFPIWRETVLVVALWLLSQSQWRQVNIILARLAMLLAGLFLIRFAGQDPLAPIRWLIAVGFLAIIAAVWLESLLSHLLYNKKPTDQYAFSE